MRYVVVTGLEGAALARTRAGARHVLAVPAVRALANAAAVRFGAGAELAVG